MNVFKIETRLVGTVCALALMMGCAHGTMRGSVAMKVSENEAHVCLGDNEVKAGDKVTLFRSECDPNSGQGKAGRSCKKIKLGEGTVEKTFNEHYSQVKVNSGVPFEEGTIVEKN